MNKYRAWDGMRMTTSGIMFNCTTSAVEVPTNNEMKPMMKLMQFSGVFDEQKKEIYESDIVEVPYGVGIVTKGQGFFWIQWLDDKEANLELLGVDKKFRVRGEIKVIGNIYQNMDILKKYNH
jgi:uncharacterized phage protein (TIGR01671 family)